jgi:hypothetical protein
MYVGSPIPGARVGPSSTTGDGFFIAPIVRWRGLHESFGCTEAACGATSSSQLVILQCEGDVCVVVTAGETVRARCSIS